MFVSVLLAAALFYPAQTCFSKKDDSGTEERDPNVFSGLTPPDEKLRDALNTTEDSNNILVGLGPSDKKRRDALNIPGNRQREDTPGSQKRKNRHDEIFFFLLNYYDILRNEDYLMENKPKHYSPLPNYLRYPRYFGYKF